MALQSIESSPADRALEYARNLGREHGTNAAGWYEQDTYGGRVSSPTVARRSAARILAGIESGDPAILDTFPQPDLSGQWADTLTGPQLVSAALGAAGIIEDPSDTQYRATAEDLFTDICDAYEQAFADAVQSETERTARLALAD